MTPAQVNYLKYTFPNISEPFLSDVPSGWFDLLVDTLNTFNQISNTSYNISIKEKFGNLRIYCSSNDTIIQYCSSLAEIIGASICQYCGSKGAPCSTARGLKTVCDKCYLILEKNI